ncbi:MAG: aldehyde dehydrogenase family protein, partial [Candidatus Eremiobacteraeota bacterium]|nr:aldehyde dehydrogenase family protein [Candidatus Eremiobacteraeota bacterium]
HPGIDAVTLSGGLRAGYAAVSVCSSLHKPLQAELGGNNAAIAWGDFDLENMAAEVTSGAFGFAGQRCTANRRLIVEESRFDGVLEILRERVSSYPVGDPRLDATDCGPMISAAQRSKFLRALEIAHDSKKFSALQPREAGYYQAPVLVWGCRPESHIVQEESFGPVLVLQTARDFEQAIELANGVKQGLAASRFCLEEDLQSRFLTHAQAGILKLNSATHGAHPEVPFGGWKRSGLGPPEHGPGDVEFYTKWQAVYG